MKKPPRKRRMSRAEMIGKIAKRLNSLSSDFETPDPNHINDMSAQLQRAYDRLRTGQATDDDIHNLVDAVNVCLKLITDERFPEAQIFAKSAEAALIVIDERKTERGRWVAKASELNAIEQFLPIHDAIVQNSAHIEIEQACAAVRKDLEAA
jgi:hypothetical protein